jgi:pimeloyl-ACP methyl ester carboxylesterase
MLSEIEIEGHRLVSTLTHSNDSGLPVCFLHGIGGSIYFWTPEETSLFQNLGSCYSLSLPGHYPAVLPKDFATASLTAELIAELLSRAIQQIVGNRKVLLVGHSTGGFAALSTAIYAPEVVAGIVSIAGFSKGQWTGVLGFNQWLVRQGSIGRAMFKKIYQFGGVSQTIYRIFWQAYVHDHTVLFAHPHFNAVVNSTFPYIRKLDLESMVNYFTVMPQIDITPYLSKITVPTCLIVGDRDPTVPPKQSATIAEKITNSDLNVIKGSGHLPFFEKPIEYKRALDSWLAEFQFSSLNAKPGFSPVPS